MLALKVDPEFESLILPPTEEEFSQLRENILSEGKVRDALIVWNGVILDGHNRWRIIQENPQIPYRTEEMSFETRNEAKAWMIRNQLGRRNLPNYERAKLALQLKPILQEEAKKNQSAGGNSSEVGRLKSAQPIKVRDELAKIAGVGHDTIEKVQVIEKSATPEEKQKLSKGEVSVNKVFTAIRKRENHKPRQTPEEKASAEQTHAIVEEMYDRDNIPEYTIDELVESIKLNADEYVTILRNLLTDRSTLLTEENRPIVADAIQEVISRIIKVKEIVE